MKENWVFVGIFVGIFGFVVILIGIFVGIECIILFMLIWNMLVEEFSLDDVFMCSCR